ncbi:hypothetical protein A2837_00895 [Candidatus Kaiserbacteria bacterium RIFCSPHIGHO2_01_FULL_46_22]|uniref:HIT domain-containing protein n=1 Tax=Candidatus Kaiserbacteria bacterium RIFCSPHIGHO2_01_FULL_46_22 TaxID=1798475 RepID=A0A1F6BY62_9BACT|nr:MAG: hypothetical protein A2837_00895 [Candidatus Kaiserbacteria bacterium RIFCSPHIGHO2_01_FULL_46_22]
MSNVFRTDKMVVRYDDYKKTAAFLSRCVLCNKSALQDFKYWRITKNDFPYDRIAKVHDMIIPLRHTNEAGLTADETAELLMIKQQYLQDYEYIIEAAETRRSIPEHFHLHLIQSKTEYT